jgi:hypothetical protein
MRIVFVAASVAALALSAHAEEKGDLAGKMKEAKISLERGIAASASTGTPISAKYEVEDGKLQLSVYTAKETRSPKWSSITRQARWPSRNPSRAATTSPPPRRRMR